MPSLPCIPCLNQQLDSWNMDTAFCPVRYRYYEANEREYLAIHAVYLTRSHPRHVTLTSSSPRSLLAAPICCVSS